MNMNCWLFGKPEWELQDDISPENLRSVGESIKARMDLAADAVEKLIKEGWEVEMMLYDVSFYKDSVKSEVAAKEELTRLGLDQEMFNFEEWDDDEDDEEWEDDEEEDDEE